ncbi:MAG: putative lipid II flippase FtsW [Acidobacteriota bacterium]|nr:putative lipid II flippase FtsW [Acidobacteriota bacterium]
MPRRLQTDIFLVGAILLLVGFGVAMVYSASAAIGLQQYGSSFHFVIRQSIYALAGLTAMWMLMKYDYRNLANPRLIFPALAVALVLLMAVFLMPVRHETHRWLYAGPLSLQPSELAKVLVIIFVAYFLDVRREAVNDIRHTLAPLGLIVGLVVALILKEPDLGTSLDIVLIAAVMLFAAGLRLRYFAGASLAAVPLLYVVITHAKYRMNRLMGFLHPNSDPLGKGFQRFQALIAVGSGGISGVGAGEGHQKLFFLPEPQTDFIFAVISEEWGFIGALVVLLLFGVILCRGLKAAAGAPDGFGKLLAMGIIVLLVGQALVNMSVVIGLLPTKGIPLPFISYGGSSLVVNLAAAGILLNISRQAAGRSVS